MDNTRNFNEAKLILLAIADQLPGMSPSTLQSLSQETLFFDYFTIAEAFQVLLEQGLVYVGESKGEKRKDLYGRPLKSCYLTPSGSQVLSQLYDQIPAAIRQKIHQLGEKQTAADDLLAFYEAAGDDTYSLTLMARDKGKPYLEIKLSTPDENTARHFKREWPCKAGLIYKNLLSLLNEKADEEP